MKTVIYIVSSIPDSGPTQQLFNMIQGLNKKQFKPVLLTLSGQINGDKTILFDNLDIEIYRLSLGGFRGIFPGSAIKKIIQEIKPDLIHSQGFRPDVLCMMLGLKIPRILTIRNIPFNDYPSKFGKAIGYCMAFIHLIAIKSCKNPVACSESIKEVFEKYNVHTKAIRNGVNFDTFTNKDMANFKTSKNPIFVSAGSLIPRKNIDLMAKIFTSKTLSDEADLFVLGDGFLRSKLEKYSSDNIIFCGHVDNPFNYLYLSDFYISLSLSEGMPNGVLEALSAGLPCILSNIGPHKELAVAMPDCIFLINHLDPLDQIAKKILQILGNFNKLERDLIKRKAKELFDSKVNSNNYQEYYKELVKDKA